MSSVVSGSSVQRQRAGPLDLPTELILSVLAACPAADGAHLLLTCRALATHLRDPSEHVWIQYCRRYRLADVSAFPSRSFRTVYTGLLHPYGPLLGLWANDAPFRGNVLQFRLFPGDAHEPGGIVGEVWRFPRPVRLQPAPFEVERPDRPRLQRALKIGFGDSCAPRRADERATVYCQVAADTGAHDVESHVCNFQVHHGKPRRRTLQFPVMILGGPDFTMPIPHPTFPEEACSPWVDLARESRPRTRASPPPPPAAHSAGPHAPVGAAGPDHAGLTSFSIACANPTCGPHHQPGVFFAFAETEAESARPRYYPVKPTAGPGVHPLDDAWTPRALEGLWLGAYGPHGTEVLFLAFDAPNALLRAYKIIGDQHVPRGVQTWMVDFGQGPVPPPVGIPGHPEFDSFPVYEGTARVSAAGFL
jgi:hypothetical protein